MNKTLDLGSDSIFSLSCYLYISYSFVKMTGSVYTAVWEAWETFLLASWIGAKLLAVLLTKYWLAFILRLKLFACRS